MVAPIKREEKGMTKAKTTTGKANTKMAPGKRQGVTAKHAGEKHAGAKRSATTTKSSTAKSSTAKRTSASRQSASGARPSKTNQEGRPGAGPALHQIRKRQSPSQIIASASAAAGIQARTGKVFTESFMTTIKSHLVPGAVGRVDVPGLNASLYRGMQRARKARTMMSPLLNREVFMPARPAQPVIRFRATPTLRKIVARV